MPNTNESLDSMLDFHTLEGPHALDTSISESAEQTDLHFDASSVPDPADLVGKRLGDVELTKIIGRGGMSTVYLGVDHEMGGPSPPSK